ncbi:unnamed protein product [Owenia fusiformis]|uniref:Uncharacterized protein n=1 Tax=Owenia fusiformis TaxID=6347 RepID=A0A8J1XFG2_OWEFU|nr:unnamed protein product [Owenia fusiformis]
MSALKTVLPKLAEFGEKKDDSRFRQRGNISKQTRGKPAKFDVENSDLEKFLPAVIQGESVSVSIGENDHVPGSSTTKGEALFPEIIHAGRLKPIHNGQDHSELEITGQDIQVPPKKEPVISQKTQFGFETILETGGEEIQDDPLKIDESLRQLLDCHSIGVPIEITKRDYIPGRVARPLFHCQRCLDNWAASGKLITDCDSPPKPVKGPLFMLSQNTSLFIKKLKDNETHSRYSHGNPNFFLGHQPNKEEESYDSTSYSDSSDSSITVSEDNRQQSKRNRKKVKGHKIRHDKDRENSKHRQRKQTKKKRKHKDKIAQAITSSLEVLKKALYNSSSFDSETDEYSGSATRGRSEKGRRKHHKSYKKNKMIDFTSSSSDSSTFDDDLSDSSKMRKTRKSKDRNRENGKHYLMSSDESDYDEKKHAERKSKQEKIRRKRQKKRAKQLIKKAKQERRQEAQKLSEEYENMGIPVPKTETTTPGEYTTNGGLKLQGRHGQNGLFYTGTYNEDGEFITEGIVDKNGRLHTGFLGEDGRFYISEKEGSVIDLTGLTRDSTLNLQDIFSQRRGSTGDFSTRDGSTFSLYFPSEMSIHITGRHNNELSYEDYKVLKALANYDSDVDNSFLLPGRDQTKVPSIYRNLTQRGSHDSLMDILNKEGATGGLQHGYLDNIAKGHERRLSYRNDPRMHPGEHSFKSEDERSKYHETETSTGRMKWRTRGDSVKHHGTQMARKSRNDLQENSTIEMNEDDYSQDTLSNMSGSYNKHERSKQYRRSSIIPPHMSQPTHSRRNSTVLVPKKNFAVKNRTGRPETKAGYLKSTIFSTKDTTADDTTEYAADNETTADTTEYAADNETTTEMNEAKVRQDQQGTQSRPATGQKQQASSHVLASRKKTKGTKGGTEKAPQTDNEYDIKEKDNQDDDNMENVDGNDAGSTASVQKQKRKATVKKETTVKNKKLRDPNNPEEYQNPETQMSYRSNKHQSITAANVVMSSNKPGGHMQLSPSTLMQSAHRASHSSCPENMVRTPSPGPCTAQLPTLPPLPLEKINNDLRAKQQEFTVGRAPKQIDVEVESEIKHTSSEESTTSEESDDVFPSVSATLKSKISFPDPDEISVLNFSPAFTFSIFTLPAAHKKLNDSLMEKAELLPMLKKPTTAKNRKPKKKQTENKSAPKKNALGKFANKMRTKLTAPKPNFMKKLAPIKETKKTPQDKTNNQRKIKTDHHKININQKENLLHNAQMEKSVAHDSNPENKTVNNKDIIDAETEVNRTQNINSEVKLDEPKLSSSNVSRDSNNSADDNMHSQKVSKENINEVLALHTTEDNEQS